MTIRKALTSIVLVGLALGGAGCSGKNSGKKYAQYEGEYQIDNNKVAFNEVSYGDLDSTNVITVQKPNGKIIKYFDTRKEDLIIESVEIKNYDFNKRYYNSDEIGQMIVEKAQKQFDDYIEKISRIKDQEEAEKWIQEAKSEQKKINQGLAALD